MPLKKQHVLLKMQPVLLKKQLMQLQTLLLMLAKLLVMQKLQQPTKLPSKLSLFSIGKCFRKAI